MFICVTLSIISERKKQTLWMKYGRFFKAGEGISYCVLCFNVHQMCVLGCILCWCFFSLYYFNYYIVIILLLLFRPCHHCCCWIQTIKCLTLLCASNRPSHVTAHPALMLWHHKDEITRPWGVNGSSGCSHVPLVFLFKQWTAILTLRATAQHRTYSKTNNSKTRHLVL